MRLLAVLLLVAAAAVAAFLLLAGGEHAGPLPESEGAAKAPPLAAGTLSELPDRSSEVERADASVAQGLGDEPMTEDPDGAHGQLEPVGWFQGRLRVVEGELPAPPALSATTSIPGERDLITHDEEIRVESASLEFRIPAMHADAECRVLLPEIMSARAAVGGEVEAATRVRFAALDQPLVIDVAVRPHAGVRFLHAETDEPLAKAQAWHRVSVEGSSTTYGNQLDAEGLMIFDFERLADVEGAEVISFAVSRPPDVGYSQTEDFSIKDFLAMPRPVVLRFGSTPRLHFRVQDPRGDPIAGARVRIGSAGAVEADADGRAEVLQSHPPGLTVEAEATGFLTTEFPLEAAAAEEQVLTLWPGSRLVIEADSAPAAGWDALKVEVIFRGKEDASALLPDRFQPGRFTESSGGTGMTSNSQEMSYELETGFSSQGRVVVDGIHVDVPARVKVQYQGFVVLDERVPFAPGDGEHVLRVPPLPAGQPIFGQVLDEAGNPVAGARVSSHSRSVFGGPTEETDASGKFSLGEAIPGSQLWLNVSATGYAPLRVEFLVVAGDADSLGVLTLLRGRTLVVQVLGPDGAPFRPTKSDVEWRLELDVDGRSVEPSEGAPTALGPSEFYFQDLPAGELGCSILVDYTLWRLHGKVSTELPRATLQLSQEEAGWLNSEE